MRSRFAVSCLGWLWPAWLLLLPASAAAAQPPDFAAQYRLSLGGITVGETRVELERLNERNYRYSSLTRPTGLAGFIYRAEVAEYSEGLFGRFGFRPDLYSYDRRGRGSRQAQVEFDWDRNQVVNSVAGGNWRLAVPDHVMDRLVSQLQLMKDLAAGRTELEYRIADGGHLRSYRLRIDGEETVTTPLGEFATVRVVNRPDTEDGRVSTFWAAPALHYLAVRIEYRERRETLLLTLEELDGIPLPEPPE